jgi:zinc finger protein
MVYTVRVLCAADLNRQIVRSSSCSIMIPEYQLTLPANRGQLTTVEGLVSNIIEDLELDQPLRRIQDESAHGKIEILLASLRIILESRDGGGDEPRPTRKSEFHPFTIKLDDPAGNSFIEFFGSMSDPNWSVKTYARTHQQDVDLGLASAGVEDSKDGDDGIVETEADNKHGETSSSEKEIEEIYIFPGTCPNCGRALHTRMQKLVIPYFKVCRVGC